MKATRRLALLGLAALAVIGLAGCGSGSSAGTSSGGGSSRTVHMTLSDDGCSPTSVTVPSGPVTFAVANAGSSAVTELELLNRSGIILGERENVVPGISGSFTLDVQPGHYVLSCPNGSHHDKAGLTVTGTAHTAVSAASGALLGKATAGYAAYVAGQSDQLLAQTHAFVAALRSGEVAKAKQLFGPVRYHYEAIEPVAESFGNLDPAIDARANDVVPPAKWTGFHKIEQILWVHGTTAGTGPLATRLQHDVATLDRRVRTLTFQPAQLANGGVELLNEVANSKITGEEDRYSHTDLSDFAANLEGARVAFGLLRPALVKQRDGKLVKTIDARFGSVQTALAKYQRATPLGYALYGQLTVADRQQLSKRVGALAEPLSTVAAKVAG